MPRRRLLLVIALVVVITVTAAIVLSSRADDARPKDPISQLQERVAKLESRVAELEQRLHLAVPAIPQQPQYYSPALPYRPGEPSSAPPVPRYWYEGEMNGEEFYIRPVKGSETPSNRPPSQAPTPPIQSR